MVSQRGELNGRKVTNGGQQREVLTVSIPKGVGDGVSGVLPDVTSGVGVGVGLGTAGVGGVGGVGFETLSLLLPVLPEV